MSYLISGHTGLIALLGSPISHSMSPMMLNEAFKELGLDYSYMAFDVNEDTLKQVTDAFKIMNVRGMNITMPCKNKMAELCDRLSPAAKLCRAVNTVVNDNGIYTGHTTDGIGFMRSAREHGLDPHSKKMVVLGTGGAGTAIIVQAALDGMSEISVFCRSTSRFYDRTKKISEKADAETDCKITIYDYDNLKCQLEDADILVNTTNVGMAPDVSGCLIPDASYLNKKTIVADVIYNPPRTKLLELAKEAGCVSFGGHDMLLYQGAESFRLWTGLDMPTENIRRKFFS